MIEEIIFIYNAKSGFFNAFLDWSHKIISPKTYDCNLCSITYNNFGKEKKWKEFLKNINIQSHFYYIDHLKELDFVIEANELPCVFIKKNKEYKINKLKRDIPKHIKKTIKLNILKICRSTLCSVGHLT